MRATYEAGHSAANLHCDACGGHGNSTSRVTLAGFADRDLQSGGVLHRASICAFLDYAHSALTLDACPTCVSKFARHCDICGNDKPLARDHCPDCARAFAVADRQETMMAKTLQ